MKLILASISLPVPGDVYGLDALLEKQLEWAKKIAKHKDDSARNSLLELLQEVVEAELKLTEMHREMDTVHRALTKIDATLNSKT